MLLMFFRILNIIRKLRKCIIQHTNLIFFMSSLVMLSTVVAIPMSNMNLFSIQCFLMKHSSKNYNYQEDERKRVSFAEIIVFG